MGLRLSLHREKPQIVELLEERSIDHWQYFRFEVPDSQKIMASSKKDINIYNYKSLNLGKYWDMFVYTISDSYRNQVKTDNIDVSRSSIKSHEFWAVIGAQIMDYETGKNLPLRHSTSRQVKNIFESIKNIDYDEISHHDDIDIMNHLGIYTCGSGTSSYKWDRIYRAILDRLKMHYKVASERNEVMIHEWV